MKAVSAAMVWKGRKLMCNGVCVAEIGKSIWSPGHFVYASYHACETFSTRKAARRAINAKFRLPLDFGEKP